MSEEQSVAEGTPKAERKSGVLRSKWFWVTLLVLVVAAGAFAGGWWITTSGTRATVHVLEAYEAVYAGTDSTKDVVDLVELYASDATFRDMAQDRTYTGIEEVEGVLEALLGTPQFDLTVEDTKVGSGWAVVVWTADGTRPGANRLTQVNGVTILEVSDDAITREAWYYDPAKAPF
jgi:hypothetical protein